ncbi:DUF3237 domain-containing protein [Sphingopyxis sp. DHUNG17]|uniref:DUF3237 domain-containing protein n=1 Tax=Sphingopyxis jiangsuensis TaxID=2871171 RepID=UPI00191D2392|nr:DUF3237 domain-containing protein [Sphingopyxis lutea]MBL0768587.1 DUF3237 domain-containing protein [Sphingopyxis lutea]
MDTLDDANALAPLRTRHLCTVEFEVEGGIIDIGASPFGVQRMGYVTGGRFFGLRINGLVLPGGGNWSRSGQLAGDEAVGTFDARSVWQADNGDRIFVSYSGRSVVPPDVRAAFADPDAAPVESSRYYLRIAPVFETASTELGWLNAILAVGVGERTDFGARHVIHEVL